MRNVPQVTQQFDDLRHHQPVPFASGVDDPLVFAGQVPPAHLAEPSVPIRDLLRQLGRRADGAEGADEIAGDGAPDPSGLTGLEPHENTKIPVRE